MISRPIVRVLGIGAVFLLALARPDRAAAQYTDVPAPAAYALTDVSIVQADGRRTDGVTVVVRGGFIEAIGRNVEVPFDARLLEGDSLVIYPGFVDAHGAADFEFPQEELDRSQIQSWDAPREVQGFQPHRRVVDVLEATGSSLASARKAGVVAAAVHPTDALMPGRGAFLVMRKHAKMPAELVHTPVLGPVFSFRGGRGAYPATLFGVLAFYRQSFEDASRMRVIAAEYTKDPRGVQAPAYDPDHAVLQEALSGAMPVYFTVDRAEDIRRALDLSGSYGLRPIVLGGEEAWQVAGRLRAENVPVLVSLDFPKPERWKPEADSATSDQALNPAIFREKQRIEDAYANAGRLADAGVRFALTSGGGKAELLKGARKAVEYGLSEEDALRALTRTPAELFGVPHLVRIEEGYAANFVVTDGPLFDDDTKILYTFVEGALEEGDGNGDAGSDGPPAVDLTGTWSVELSAPDGTITATMKLAQDGADFSGTMSTAEFGELKVTGGKVSGESITFLLIVDAGGQVVEMQFRGTATEDSASGSGSGPFGEVGFTARRTSGPGGER